MRQLFALLIPAAALFVAAPARAADFDVLDAVEGVWAYDPAEVASPGDFTCADRPMAMAVVDGGQRIASKRPGDAAERYGLILDIRNDFPLGPALSVVWEDAPQSFEGEPIAMVLVMESPDSFVWIGGEDLEAYVEGEIELGRSPLRRRCGAR